MPDHDQRDDAYSSALFEVAKAEGSLASVEEELFRFARTLEASDDLRMTLSDAAIPMDRKLGIVQDLLSQRAAPVTVALVSFVVGSGRAGDLPKIIDGLVERAAAERQEAVAEVRSAIPLDDGTRDRLAAALSKATGKKVSVKVVVDPGVIGGVVAQIGDTVIDGSVRRRLEQLKEAL